MKNPFKYGCVVAGKYFCSRTKLMKRLAEYIVGGQNLVIQGDRRMGKSSLIANTLKGMRGYHPLMIDLMGVKSVADICNRVADALVRFDETDSMLRQVAGLFSHLKPVMTIDSMSGMPTISVDRRASTSPSNINVAINAIEHHVKGRKSCVVFDEFQDILDLKDGEQVLAIMRSRIQYLQDTAFVYLGSSRNEMLNIFMSPKSPFYKSALMFSVGEMDEKVYFEFIRKKFVEGSRTLSKELFGEIWALVDHTTGDVQELCDALWSVTQENEDLTHAHVVEALKEIYRRESFGYATFVKGLTDIQLRVLKALAQLGGEHPQSVEFMEAAQVMSHASIKRALTSLSAAGLIYPQTGDYKFVSPFFREWIKSSGGKL